MAQDSNNKLKSQIEDAFGKVLYTETCHYNLCSTYKKWNNIIKITQIVLSAISTGSFLSILISTYVVNKNLELNLEQTIAFYSAIVSLLALILTTLAYNFRFDEKAVYHKKIADKLWLIRNSYISLLTDFDSMNEDDIRKQRDLLYTKTNEIYSNDLEGTTKKSFNATQLQLKVKNSQNFTSEELNNLLPTALQHEDK